MAIGDVVLSLVCGFIGGVIARKLTRPKMDYHWFDPDTGITYPTPEQERAAQARYNAAHNDALLRQLRERERR